MEANNHVKYRRLIARCGDLPPTPEILDDLERFLREQRKGE